MHGESNALTKPNSFLPTNEAVVTTILSSRWKPLWTLIPKLNLEDNSISDHTVYSVLAQHAAPILQNFILSWRSPCRSSHLNKWIHTAISRNVQQLDLQIERGRLFELPDPRRFESAKEMIQTMQPILK